jgi:hypothetical protein
MAFLAWWVNHPTCNEEDLRAFWHAHDGRVIAKPLASGYLERPDGSVASIYTSRVLMTHIDAEPRAQCPTLFQQEIVKEYDVRVTIVDDRVTAVALRRSVDGAQVVDIRRDNMDNVEYTNRRPCCKVAFPEERMTNRKGSRHLPKQVGKSRKSRSHRLTRRQREFLARILEHPWMSSARAARESGYSESVARKANRIILGSPRVWRAYKRAQAAMAEIVETDG